MVYRYGHLHSFCKYDFNEDFREKNWAGFVKSYAGGAYTQDGINKLCLIFEISII